MLSELGGDGMRRRVLSELGLEECGLKYTTGEFVGNGSGLITVEHGLGEVPFIFAFIAEPENETLCTLSGIFMNTGLVSYYTSSVTKQFMETGSIAKSYGDNTVLIQKPSSTAYGVRNVDENEITILQYASKHIFINGKVYKWIAIADWRA